MLHTPLTKNMLHTTDTYMKSLTKAGILTVGDMLALYPRDYEDRTHIIESFSYVNVKEKNTVLVKLISVENTRTSWGKILTKAVVEDKNGFLSEAVWFNRKYLGDKIGKITGKKIILIGKVKYDYGKLSFVGPEIETDLSKLGWEIVPVYSDVNYIPGSWFATKMEYLKKYCQYFSETLPEPILQKYQFLSKAQSVEKIHFPTSKWDIEHAKERLSYEELYEINYKTLSKKHQSFQNSEWKSFSVPLNAELIKELISKLPFELTGGQKIALFQILKDMEKNHAMQRLLEWDVGTGKTIIAAISVIHTLLELRKKWIFGQVAIMAPTEILARQHFEGLSNMFFSHGLSSELLVWSTTAKNKESIKEKLKNWNIDIIIGTHALIQDDVFFKNLVYVIIDEQHRFWVKQREVLEKYMSGAHIPHNLNMTATPIPRTLALTLYGDQDLSVLSEYPKERKIIHTKVARTPSAREEIEKFIHNELQKGRQVFWISPLVEESEKIDLANALSTYESLIDIFAPFQVGLLHGKMKPREKEEIMGKFARNEIQVLSSTSVVEVGVNIPNATIMCIEWAERFGLSQLHQFRWRVGRGKYQSYCYLFPTSWNTTERLSAMEKSNNGFELSEIDLELRGPWEVYGVRQSWVPEFKIADMKDLGLISQIREDIEELVLEKKV